MILNNVCADIYSGEAASTDLVCGCFRLCWTDDPTIYWQYHYHAGWKLVERRTILACVDWQLIWQSLTPTIQHVIMIWCAATGTDYMAAQSQFCYTSNHFRSTSVQFRYTTSVLILSLWRWDNVQWNVLKNRTNSFCKLIYYCCNKTLQIMTWNHSWNKPASTSECYR